MTSSIQAKKQILLKLGSILFALLLWQAASWLLGSKLLLPSPLSIAGRLGSIWTESGFFSTLWFTSWRIMLGFFLALVLGTAFAALAGHFSIVKTLFYPFSSTIKSVPVASFILILLVYLSAGQLSIFIPFLMALPIIYHNLLQGIQAVDPKLCEVASLFHFAWYKRILYLWIPQLYPYLRSACETALGFAWKAGIAAEIIGIPDGSIGQMFYDAKIHLNSVDLFAWTFLVVILSVILEKAFLFVLEFPFRRLPHS